MDIFAEFAKTAGNMTPQAQGGTAGTVAPAGAAANPLAPNAATTVSDGSGPKAIPAVPGVADAEKSPLAAYEKLWETDPNAKKPGEVAPTFNIDATKLNEVVSKMDFTSTVDQALVTKALAGDAAAMTQVMNSVAQSSFAQSAQTTSRIVEKAVQQTAERMMTEVLPAKLREHSVANHVQAENPILDNPAVKPMADMLRDTITAKNPTASPAEINNQVRTYLAGFAKMVTDAKIGQPTEAIGEGKKVARKAGGASDNWEDFFGAKE